MFFSEIQDFLNLLYPHPHITYASKYLIVRNLLIFGKSNLHHA